MMYSIQAYRALAAILVVLFHANSLFEVYFGQNRLTKLFSCGDSGVCFFFVLSGFLIFKLHENDFLNHKKIIPYLKKRLYRIYPMYWIASIAFIGLALITGTGDYRIHDPRIVIKGLLLIPQHPWPILGVGWTLVHEVFFYCVFALCLFLFSRIVFLYFCVFVFLFICVFQQFNIVHIRPFEFLLSPFNALFLIGVFTAFFTEKTSANARFVFFVFGIAFFACLGAIKNIYCIELGTMSWLFGVSSALILIGSGTEKIEKIFKNKLQLIGNASYSIYLFHYPILSATAKLLTIIHASIFMSISALFCIITITAIGACLCIYSLIESPINKKIKNKLFVKSE